MSAPLTMILLNIKSRASSQRQKRWWLWVAPLRVESLHRWKDAGFETVTSELFHPDPFLQRLCRLGPYLRRCTKRWQRRRRRPTLPRWLKWKVNTAALWSRPVRCCSWSSTHCSLHSGCYSSVTGTLTMFRSLTDQHRRTEYRPWEPTTVSAVQTPN